MSKTRLVLTMLIVLGGVGVGFSAQALMIENKDVVQVHSDQVVASSLAVAGSSITIDGKVQGDIFCAGQSVVINGFVDGDVFCAGQSITINGEVRGNVRAVGNTITINGKVARNVMVAGSNIVIGSKAQVGWDVLFAGATASVQGMIKRDVEGAGSNLTLDGQIGRNVYFMSGNNHKEEKSAKEENQASIHISKQTVIEGDFGYKARQDAYIEEGATIKGATNHYMLMGREERNHSGATGWVWWVVVKIFSALLVGLILVSWLKKPVTEITHKMFTQPLITIGIGLLLLIVTPLISLILMITLIGFPLGLIVLGLWLMILYLANILVAIALGEKINQRWNKKFEPGKNSLVHSMIIGVIILYLIFSIPIIGGLLCFITLLYGLGIIWQYIRGKMETDTIQNAGM